MYYCFNLVIIMVAVFLSALVVNVCRAGETKQAVPRALKKVRGTRHREDEEGRAVRAQKGERDTAPGR